MSQFHRWFILILFFIDTLFLCSLCIRKSTYLLLWILVQIKCSSVISMLDCIINLRTDVQHGKKKRKNKKHNIRSSVGTGDKALTFISFLFDIVVLKKDMENRYAFYRLHYGLLALAAQHGYSNVVSFK